MFTNSEGMCFVQPAHYSGDQLKSLRGEQTLNSTVANQLHALNLYCRTSTRRGKRAGRKCHKSINVCISNRTDKHVKQRGANCNNLIGIPSQTQTNSTRTSHSVPLLDFCVINARSINNKSQKIKDFVVDNDLDILAITETWLSSENDTSYVTGELCPNGYKFLHIPRCSRGGGVGLLFKGSLKVKLSKCSQFSTFEHAQYVFKSTSKCYQIFVVYRPPPSSKNKCTISSFMEEFSTFLEQSTIMTGEMLLVGDFNFHIEDPTDTNAVKFMHLIESFDLKQHVLEPTHYKGHMLDLVITRSSDEIVGTVCLSDPDISDHFAIKFKLLSEKIHFQRKSVTFRKLKSLDTKSFQTDIEVSTLHTSPLGDISDAIEQYDRVLSELLEKHAPIQRKTITIRPSAPWYSEQIRDAKLLRRKYERRWRRTKLCIDHDIYKEQCKLVSNMIDNARSTHYNEQIITNSSDQKALYQVVDKLMHRKSEPMLPSHDSLEDLANKFADFFADKIVRIRSDLDVLRTNVENTEHHASSEAPDHLLTDFKSVSEDEVYKIIKSSPTKSCALDPIPTWILKECIGPLLPVITQIVNLSLSSNIMPSSLKEAILAPLLKKVNLDFEIFKNFRPVSNLAFISKLIERVVASQFVDHMSVNNLHELFQSAYRKFHSTETALTKVHSDMLGDLDQRQSILLILIDLSAAFDTIDHEILLSLLSTRLGVRGNALLWIRSYLQDRHQTVTINGVKSARHKLKYGVPQGSVLGPILFTAYMLPLGDIIRNYNMQFHFYADDSQLYLTFTPGDNDSSVNCKKTMENCINHVKTWMANNLLKLNDEKTEMLLVGSPSTEIQSIQVGKDTITPSDTVRNIGVIFDANMNMQSHINSIAKRAHFQIRNIGRIRRFLTQEAAVTLVHAFISSKIDYCNALLYGLPLNIIAKIQRIQNTAARVVTGTRKYEHITPVLHKLHWLPVKQRIEFKILLLTFKGLHSLAPCYITELLITHSPTRSLRSGDAIVLKIPKTRSKYGRRAFSHSGPTLWNQLPMDIRQCQTVQTFKSKLKTHLFKIAYGAI